jgi:hypothetical protein
MECLARHEQDDAALHGFGLAIVGSPSNAAVSLKDSPAVRWWRRREVRMSADDRERICHVRTSSMRGEV